MDPNNNNPSTTPPANDVPPAEPSTPEVAATPEQPSAPAEQFDSTPVEPAAPTVEPVAPAQPEAPANQFAQAPAPTPTPEAAPTSVFSTTTGAPQAPKNEKSKKMILIAGIVGGALLLAIIGFVVYSMLTTVSKEDYRDAARQFNEVSSASAAMTSDARSLGSATASSSNSTFEESVTEAEASVTKINTENEKLSQMKAVRVGEGAELYKTFDSKVDAYTAYASELITSVKGLRPALTVCDKIGDASDANARAAAMRECSTALGEVKDVPNEQMKTYYTAIAKAYGEYATVYEKVSAIASPFGAQYEEYKALRDQMTAVQKTITDASKKFSTELKTRDEELSVKESADALADYLTEQQK